jgi:hypothetical protein
MLAMCQMPSDALFQRCLGRHTIPLMPSSIEFRLSKRFAAHDLISDYFTNSGTT